MCENSVAGFCVLFDKYCAFVNGCTKVPTLATTARLPAVQSPCRPGSAGCRP